METKKIQKEAFSGDSDLFKAVKLLEENGFYVVHADFGCNKDYPGALLLQAYPKRTVSVEFRPD